MLPYYRSETLKEYLQGTGKKNQTMNEMTEEILIAGWGRGSVDGKNNGLLRVMQDMEVSWMPSYGPEMRGRTANVIVILSSDRISSPIIRHLILP
jgi:hypothetical protein